jgi:hypothetical protein
MMSRTPWSVSPDCSARARWTRTKAFPSSSTRPAPTAMRARSIHAWWARSSSSEARGRITGGRRAGAGIYNINGRGRVAARARPSHWPPWLAVGHRRRPTRVCWAAAADAGVGFARNARCDPTRRAAAARGAPTPRGPSYKLVSAVCGPQTTPRRPRPCGARPPFQHVNHRTRGARTGIDRCMIAHPALRWVILRSMSDGTTTTERRRLLERP